MPPAVRHKIDTLGGFWAALVSVLPELGPSDASSVHLPAPACSAPTPASVWRARTGLHVYIVLVDGNRRQAVPAPPARALPGCTASAGSWSARVGTFLYRSLVDRMVYGADRLVFEGAPVLDPSLKQDLACRVPAFVDGAALDSRAACFDLTIVEQAQLTTVQRASAHRAAPQAAAARANFIARQAITITSRTGITEAQARRIAERQCEGVLLPDIVLGFDDEGLNGATVADVLADPERYIGATLADPLEGLDYGPCKAKVMRRADGTLWIHSFAHGRTTYELKHDARSVKAAIQKVSPDEAVDLFVALLLIAALEPDEEHQLREVVCKHSGTKARPLAAKIKAVRSEHEKRKAEAEREWRAAQPRDRRVRIEAPVSDVERLPILSALDEVLTGINDAEPPPRDAERRPTEARCRAPILLHEMLNTETTAENPHETDPPARAGDAAPDAA